MQPLRASGAGCAQKDARTCGLLAQSHVHVHTHDTRACTRTYTLALARSEGIVLVDVSSDEWPIVFCNDAWEQLTCFQKEELGRGFWQSFSVGGWGG